ncbi:uncharacterized protein LOC110032969 [Phalaenopsis equestris]|uniref:uncharacterized protein LOC110032969 n=1 Tax=Phalaenopsis equestris TaxID=78828 RepID=UPI0009E1AE61|nr:uncharacterized protein LOC110032969 [Phalaenopsis equestris]
MLVEHPTRFHKLFRMTQEVFTDLLAELVGSHGLHGSMRMTDREVLAIALFILSQNESMCGAMERFQHSSETISRYFSVGLSALVSLAKQVIKPIDPTFSRTPTDIRQDRRYMSFFKDFIGAIDGTHVDARVSNDEKVAFIGRSGPQRKMSWQFATLICVSHLSCLVGRVEPMIVGFSRVQHEILIIVFPILLKVQHLTGKYYLVDVGYPLQRGYLKLYPDTRYHIPDFERASNATRNRKEVFNKRYFSLRGVIERTFGVWKKKWVILRDMSPYALLTRFQSRFKL